MQRLGLMILLVSCSLDTFGIGPVFDATGMQGTTNGSNSTTGPTLTTDVTNPTSGPTTNESMTTMNPVATDPSTMGSETTVDTTATGGPGTAASTGDDFEFVFRNDPPEAYTQIERHGAVEAGTIGIRASQGLGFPPDTNIGIRDDYNASDPAEDAAGMWIDEITDSITYLISALDEDITMMGFTPATVDVAIAQLGPVLVPDTIKYDPDLPTGYPNGRWLEDPVIDITLAALLLELGPNQPLYTFVDLPLNPPANDVPFLVTFPYLAPPHVP